MTDNDFAMPTQLMDNATVSSSSPPTPDASPAVSTDISISAQTSPIFTLCDFVFLQDISSADIDLGTPVRAADVRISTTSTSVSIGNSAKPTSSSMLTGASFSSLSSAVIISNYKPSSQNNSADDDTFRFSFASDFSEDLPLPFAILGLFSYKRCTPDTFRGGGHFKFFISILALHFEIAGVCRGNMFHHPLINLYMSTPDLSQQKSLPPASKVQDCGSVSEEILPLLQSFTFFHILRHRISGTDYNWAATGYRRPQLNISNYWDLQALPPARNQQLFG